MYTKNITTKFLLLLIATGMMLTLLGSVINAYARPHAALPSTPGNFRSTERTVSSITLAWDSVAGSLGYAIYKFDDNSGIFQFYTSVGASTLTYTDNNINCNNPNASSRGDYYTVAAFNTDGYSTQTGWVPPRPENNEFINAIDISSATIPGTASDINICNATSNASFLDPEVPECGMNAGENTVWYEFTASSNSAVSFDTEGSNFDSFIAVWTGTDTDYTNGTLTAIACNNDISASSEQSAVGFQTTTGTTYYIEIGHYAGTSGASATSINTNGPPESEQAK